MTAKICSICGKKFGLMGIRYPLRSGECICADCAKAANLSLMEAPAVALSELAARKEKKEAALAEMGDFAAPPPGRIAINETSRRWYLPVKKGKAPAIHGYEDIVDFELLEDGTTISRGGVGRALVGAATFGAVGAIVGGATGKRRTANVCSRLEIKITLKDIVCPVEYIRFISGGSIKKDGTIYKMAEQQAQQCLSLLQVMCDSSSSQTAPATPSSAADELLKLKSLLDAGVITQAEFDDQKKKLLS